MQVRKTGTGWCSPVYREREVILIGVLPSVCQPGAREAALLLFVYITLWAARKIPPVVWLLVEIFLLFLYSASWDMMITELANIGFFFVWILYRPRMQICWIFTAYILLSSFVWIWHCPVKDDKNPSQWQRAVYMAVSRHEVSPRVSGRRSEMRLSPTVENSLPEI